MSDPEVLLGKIAILGIMFAICYILWDGIFGANNSKKMSLREFSYVIFVSSSGLLWCSCVLFEIEGLPWRVSWWAVGLSIIWTFVNWPNNLRK